VCTTGKSDQKVEKRKEVNAQVHTFIYLCIMAAF